VRKSLSVNAASTQLKKREQQRAAAYRQRAVTEVTIMPTEQRAGHEGWLWTAAELRKQKRLKDREGVAPHEHSSRMPWAGGTSFRAAGSYGAGRGHRSAAVCCQADALSAAWA